MFRNRRKEFFLHAVSDKIEEPIVQARWYGGQEYKSYQIKIIQIIADGLSDFYAF